MNKNSIHNKDIFSKNASIFDIDYWREDEEEATNFLLKGKILIGGVGGGRTVPYILKKGFSDIETIDISPDMIDICKRRFPNIKSTVMDLQKTTFDDEYFDSIFLPFHTIAYVDSIENTLKEMSRILKPKGRLVFSIPNKWYIKYIISFDIFFSNMKMTEIKRGKNDSLLKTFVLSMYDKYWINNIFKTVQVRSRVSLQKIQNPNWKDKILQSLPFLDKSLYFFCSK